MVGSSDAKPRMKKSRVLERSCLAFFTLQEPPETAARGRRFDRFVRTTRWPVRLDRPYDAVAGRPGCMPHSLSRAEELRRRTIASG
ncbi:MAG: hypothetical protein DHS20C21_17410 [Gemmatimonadota bacterium]|nr:MAG: hypothetical protein DHS20C21_17410 [Gemmatimonadota bacterium]